MKRKNQIDYNCAVSSLLTTANFVTFWEYYIDGRTRLEPHRRSDTNQLVNWPEPEGFKDLQK